MLYAPEGFAHGYQTLLNDTEMCYMTSALYAPEAARGVRYDAVAFGILWPLPSRRYRSRIGNGRITGDDPYIWHCSSTLA
jgi:dTDP-4-dehydrorhamnose 3,5-epimerase-like enzyme